jgi:uncharacterized membrane protein YtjA (UPF0391 family)
LTGFIPPLRNADRVGRPRILFRTSAEISQSRSLEKAGTFVPRQDYFGSRCTAPMPRTSKRNENRGRVMLSWVVTFLVVALIAGILGFGGVAGVSIEIAKAIFFIAVILFIVSAVVGLARGRNQV